jgi:hypothetical protein
VRLSDGLLYLGIAGLVWGAWYIVQATGLRSASDTGYWLGVFGGLLMLMLFAYPLRKRVRFMARWGAAKWWFWVHLVLGVLGPTLVLVHSTFQVGSVNAGVALYSMLIVAGSGVVGRFLYLRTSRGWRDEQQALSQQAQVLAQLLGALPAGAPARASALDALRRLERSVQETPAREAPQWGLFVTLPWRLSRLRRVAWHELRIELTSLARDQAWDRRRFRIELRRLRASLQAYTGGVLRVAQFATAARLFSLWHVLHVPFVYVMVLCAIVHVVAVHAY